MTIYIVLSIGEDRRGSHTMNNSILKRKKNKDKKKDLSFADEEKKTKAVVDTSTDIHITDTPDVATWNKGMQIKGEAADIVKRSHEAKRATNTTPTAINIGLKEKGSKDLTIDPADKKDVDKIVRSDATLTDEADLS